MRGAFTAQAGTEEQKMRSPGFTPPIKFTTGTLNFNGNSNLVVKIRTYTHTLRRAHTQTHAQIQCWCKRTTRNF